jgi:membrane protein
LAVTPFRSRDTGGQPDDERGRSATKPSEIPARGWKDIAFRIYANIGDDRVVAMAASVTFYAILALFPAIAAVVALYGLFSDPRTISSHLESLSAVLPGGAMQVLSDEINRIAAQANSKLGSAFLIGLVTALWSANAGIKSLIDALNIVYKEPEKRNFFRLNAASLIFTLAIIVFVLTALAAMVVLPPVLEYFEISSFAEQMTKICRWPAMLVVVMFGLSYLYRYGPSRAEPKWRWITWGSGFAALAWLVVSLLFTWYAAHFGSYNKTYGSLGAIVGFMVWIWLSNIVILLGAEINAETEHQTARDTTTGSPKPLGERRAHMADTIGRSK